MQISLRIADSAKSFLASTEDPKAAWKSLEKPLVRSSKGCNLTTLRGDLDTYKKFAKPVEISAAGGGKIYANIWLWDFASGNISQRSRTSTHLAYMSGSCHLGS